MVTNYILNFLDLFGTVKCFPRQVIGAPKKKTLASIFPAAKMDGVVSPELTKYVVLRMPQLYVSQSVPLYEKVPIIVAKMCFSHYACHIFSTYCSFCCHLKLVTKSVLMSPILVCMIPMMSQTPQFTQMMG